MNHSSTLDKLQLYAAENTF